MKQSEPPVIVATFTETSRNKNGGRSSAGLLNSLLYVGEDGLAEMLGAGLLGVRSTNDVCACFSRVNRVPEQAVGTSFLVRRIPYSMACRAWKLSSHQFHRPFRLSLWCGTHVPCFPVKPWKSTFVSPLMRRFLMVFAYGEELVAYCRDAVFWSAALRGRRMACIVTIIVPREQAVEKEIGEVCTGGMGGTMGLRIRMGEVLAAMPGPSSESDPSLADNLKLLFTWQGSLHPSMHGRYGSVRGKYHINPSTPANQN